jgi:anti-anti-sigma factor
MTVQVCAGEDGRSVRLVMSGSLDAAKAEQAIRACRQLPGVSWERLEVELVHSDHVEIEGFELLLELQERTREQRSFLRLVGCDPEVKRMFDVAGLKRHFVIQEGAAAAAN